MIRHLFAGVVSGCSPCCLPALHARHSTETPETAKLQLGCNGSYSARGARSRGQEREQLPWERKSMNTKEPILLHTRRRFLGSLTAAAAAFTVPGAFAEELARTAWVEEGPFYPPRLP